MIVLLFVRRTQLVLGGVLECRILQVRNVRVRQNIINQWGSPYFHHKELTKNTLSYIPKCCIDSPFNLCVSTVFLYYSHKSFLVHRGQAYVAVALMCETSADLTTDSVSVAAQHYCITLLPF